MRQCELLGLCRSSLYYHPKPVSDADLKLMRRIDELHLKHPFLGARRLARMLEREGFDVGRRHVGTYSVIMERGAAKPRIYPSTDDGTETGKPVLFSPEEHEKRRRAMSKAIFASQMLQKPISKATATFDINHLRFAEIRPKTVNIFILGDPANSKKRDSDRTGFAVLAMDAQRNFFLVDGYNHKMNLGERWQALSGLRKRWMNEPGVQSVRVGYEKYGMQADIEHFQSRMEIDGNCFEIEEVAWVKEGSQSKDEEGRLYDLRTRFITEFINHPGLGSYKDLLDATSRVYDLNPRPPVIINEKDLEPPTFDE